MWHIKPEFYAPVVLEQGLWSNTSQVCPEGPRIPRKMVGVAVGNGENTMEPNPSH